MENVTISTRQLERTQTTHVGGARINSSIVVSLTGYVPLDIHNAFANHFNLVIYQMLNEDKLMPANAKWNAPIQKN